MLGAMKTATPIRQTLPLLPELSLWLGAMKTMGAGGPNRVTTGIR